MPTTFGAMITMTSAEKIESAKQLIRLGLALLPLVPGGKTPPGPGPTVSGPTTASSSTSRSILMPTSG